MALHTTSEGELLKELITARGGARPIIDGWNFAIRHRFREIMESLKFATDDGNYGIISNPVFVRPSVHDLKTGQSRPLLPAEARRTGQSLEAQMFGTLTLYSLTPTGLIPIPGQQIDVYLGKFPIMILSELDPNVDLSEMERYMRGEPEKDAGGYFIIRGMEKFMNSPEHLKMLYPFLYEDKPGISVVRYTSQTIKDKTVNIIMETNSIVEATFDKIGTSKNKFNIFYFYYCLGFPNNTIENAFAMMDMFITGPKATIRRRRLREYLEPTVGAFHIQTGGMAEDRIFSVLAEGFSTTVQQMYNRNAEITQLFRTDVLKNIVYQRGSANQESILAAKLRTFSFMVVKYVEHKNGYRGVDDRDSWGNKALGTPGHNFEGKFAEIWKKMMIALGKQVSEKKWRTVEQIKNGIKYDLMSKEFHDAFTKGIWGRRDIPIVESLKRDSHVAVISQIRRITTPTNRRAKIREKRMVHLSQWNIICPETTPEGDACGLVKDPAISVYYSHERDRSPILARLENRYSTVPSENATTSLFLNGIHLGFCNGEQIHRYLVSLRRTQQIYFDCQIVLNEYNELWVGSTGGRFVVPYLVVDPDTQELVIDRKRLRGANIETLLSNGALEYIDNSEQEQVNILIAKTRDDLIEFREDLSNVQEGIRRVQEEFAAGRATVEDVTIAQTALTNINKLMKFTHCIIDPSSILGTAASLMPYPQHNPSARITYQCLKLDTPVLMADGTQKEIKDIQIGDEVISFNPTTLVQKKTRVVNQFVRPTDKPIVEIKTFSGRTITATSDHPFLTTEGWMAPSQMIPGQTLVGISSDNSDIIFVPVESVTSVANCLIADITVESDNHSFIANGFCVHNSGMAKQALGGKDQSRADIRFDTNVRTMVMPDVPIVSTDMHEQLGMDRYPSGATAIVAITVRAQNQEDAISFNKASIQRGMFMMTIYHSYKAVIKQSKDAIRVVEVPQNKSANQASRYGKLDPKTGIIKVGQYVYPQDCLVGVTIINNETKETRDGSVYVEINKEGIVEEVFETQNAESLRMIEVRIRETRSPEIADKFASRYSQKGVVGEFVEQVDMPFIMSPNPALNGVIPDIIFNPHGIPTRMTIGKLIEILAAKAALMKGERVNATAFRRANIRGIKDALEEIGFSRSGMEHMVDGATGRVMDAEIYVGAVYYQLLRHLVKYKMQARGTGPIQYLTRQPVSGIRREGGLRFGEMERDAVIGSGGQALLQERFMKSSDVFRPVACRTCGLVLTNDAYRGEFKCQLCKHNVDPIRLELPYPFHLLSKYLAAVNVKLTARLTANK